MAGICLTLGKRREIERLYNDDMRPSEIAAAVGVTTATIYRKLKRGETGELDKHFRLVVHPVRNWSGTWNGIFAGQGRRRRRADARQIR